MVNEINNDHKPQGGEESSIESYTLLDKVETCSFTGMKYDAVRKVKCICPCHDPNENMIHDMPCCDDGYIEVFRYIK